MRKRKKIGKERERVKIFFLVRLTSFAIKRPFLSLSFFLSFSPPFSYFLVKYEMEGAKLCWGSKISYPEKFCPKRISPKASYLQGKKYLKILAIPKIISFSFIFVKSSFAQLLIRTRWRFSLSDDVTPLSLSYSLTLSPSPSLILISLSLSLSLL